MICFVLHKKGRLHMATRSKAWFPSERAIQPANGDLQRALGVPLKSV